MPLWLVLSQAGQLRDTTGGWFARTTMEAEALLQACGEPVSHTVTVTG